jgi:hypothetical protein
MHGSESAFQKSERCCRSAPRPAFLAFRIDAFQRAATFSETGPDARNGFLLARNGFRSHGLHSGVNAPSLLLRFLLGCSQARSDLAPRLVWFVPSRPLHSHIPLPVRFFARPVSLLPPLPFRGLPAPPDQSVLQQFADHPAFRLRPISVRSPLGLYC